MTTNTLENFSLYLWDNPEGLHVTVTTNFGLPSEKRSFFSFGKQTHQSWRAYNLHQPEALKPFFSHFKELNQLDLKKHSIDYWISKLAVNTGTQGRRTARGAMILIEEAGKYAFILKLGEHEFREEFDDSGLSQKQKRGAKGRCIGEYRWNNQSAIDDYAEAF
jgi:hypothetical protein